MAMTPGPPSKRAHIRFSTDGHTLCHIPVGDLILQTELRVATEQDVTTFRCPYHG